MTDSTLLKIAADHAIKSRGTLLADAAKANYDGVVTAEAVFELASDNERLLLAEKNDAIAYKAVIEKQEELRAEVDQLKEEIDELRKTAGLREELREELGFSSWRDLTESFSLSEQHRNDLQDTIVSLRTEIGALRQKITTVHFVCDRLPDQDGCRFIELENDRGESVGGDVAEWHHRDDGLVELRVELQQPAGGSVKDE